MTEELFTEESNDISADEVKAYLAGEEKNENPGAIPEDIMEMLQEEEKEDEEQRVEITPDKSFEENKRDIFENMYVSVRDVDVPITEEDKLLYLKGILNSTPITLKITAKNGMSGKCRSLSVYEGDVAAGALGKYLEKYPNTALEFQDSILQQYRVAMQLTEYCNRPIGYLSYDRESGTFEEHVEHLFKNSQKVLDVPGPVYGMYVRLINVFQYKIGKLHEAAFNSDFWSPVGAD